jgi:hypothetical protein
MTANATDNQTAFASSPVTTAASYSAANASSSSNVFCSWSNGYVYSNSDDTPSSSTAAAAASTKLSAASLSMAMHSGLAGQQGSIAVGSTAAAAAAAAAGGSIGPGGRCRAGVPVDMLSYGISYPQFVEVLLCMMAGRATALLEPEVKQLRQLSMDEEMQVRAGASRWLCSGVGL